MPTVRVLFARSKGGLAVLSTPIICGALWSRWSHVALIMEDGATVIDATFTHGGVKQRALADVLAASSDTQERAIYCPNPAAVYAFARAQVGRPYDWRGVLGLGVHRDWQADDAWFCSELVEACLAAGGNTRFVNNPRRVTPRDSWVVA